MEIANLSDAEFKTLVVSMLKEIIEYGKKIKEEVRATLSETKRNLQGTNSGENEAKNQINDLEHKEEKLLSQKSRKKEEFKKLRIDLGTSGTTLNIPISKSWGFQKEKRKSKKLKTYLKNNERKLH